MRKSCQTRSDGATVHSSTVTTGPSVARIGYKHQISITFLGVRNLPLSDGSPAIVMWRPLLTLNGCSKSSSVPVSKGTADWNITVNFIITVFREYRAGHSMLHVAVGEERKIKSSTLGEVEMNFSEFADVPGPQSRSYNLSKLHNPKTPPIILHLVVNDENMGVAKVGEDDEGGDISAPVKVPHISVETPEIYEEEKNCLNIDEMTTKRDALAAALKELAPEFVLLEESLTTMKQNLQRATQHNEELATQLCKLVAVKDTLGNQLEEACEACKRVLGQTLTVKNSETEIQECSRNISELTKKVLGIKPVTCIIDSNCTLVPSPPKGSETLMKPLVLQQQLQEYNPSATEPFHFLCSLTDTLAQLQECRFAECTKLADQHTRMSKDLSEQVTLGHSLHKQIEEIQGLCSELMREHKTKWMLMRGLEGNEQFIALPDVWLSLSELLPQAQQGVVDLFVAKASLAAASSPPFIQQQSHQHTTATSTALPGCTATPLVFPFVPPSNNVCMECDERVPNVRLHPCGHIVLCSQCASTMRKCPQCRTQIHQKQTV
ncbi:hypothetical protein Pelo_18483 [Pelomyxa schiedti]|nr:hypothetical protein Pelo_18483 [Pelomyxa schiedti]